MALSQEQRTPKQKYYVNSEGKLFWYGTKPMYLFVADNPEGTNSYRLKSEVHKDYTNPLFLDTEGVNFIRTNWAADSMGKQIQPKFEVLFEVYKDSEAPITAVEFINAPKYTNEDKKLFYGKKLTFKSTAEDEYSGVQSIFYSIDSKPFSAYKNEMVLNQDKEYGVMVYAADNVGNVEPIQVYNFRVDLTNPVSTYDVHNDRSGMVFSPRTYLTLTSIDPTSGVRNTMYRIDNNDELKYGTDIKLTGLSDGEHTITYYATDNVENKEVDKKIDFYLDSTPPVVEATIVGDQYQNRGRVFVSTRTKVKLISEDNKSGVKKVQYSVDGGQEKTYFEPFTLDKSKGNHVVKFWASDKVNNTFFGELKEENLSRTSLDIDMDAPEINYEFSTGKTYFSRDTSFITSKTDIGLLAKDADSGVKGVGYKINGGSGEEYDKPFHLLEEGFYTVDFYGTDNVNNRNTKSFFFVVDNTGPVIEHILSMEPVGKISLDEKENKPIPVYSKGVRLFLAATDGVVDTDKVFYTINGGAEKEYVSPIRVNNLGIVIYAIRAIDKLGNETKTESFEIFIK